MAKTKFEQRRIDDPQGLIDAQLLQIARQAKEIHRRGLRIEELAKGVKDLTNAMEKTREKLQKMKEESNSPSGGMADATDLDN